MATLGEGAIDLDEVLAEVERRLLLEALAKTGGVRSQAAKLLGVTFRSIRYRLEKHGIEVGDSGEDDTGQDSSPSSRRG
jgi:two-component system response regulator PilR (NtrC family)